MSNRWKPSDCAKVVLSLEATQAKLKKSEKLKKLETKIQQQSESQFSQAKVILESIEKQVITLTLEKIEQVASEALLSPGCEISLWNYQTRCAIKHFLSIWRVGFKIKIKERLILSCVFFLIFLFNSFFVFIYIWKRSYWRHDLFNIF
ncbi:MAG: hypothetical protein HC763_25920 [Hydrococcus sp. CRU_1_1]|nr:hypothetical protein [Hydrococcus sp. CRU_1_1]